MAKTVQPLFKGEAFEVHDQELMGGGGHMLQCNCLWATKNMGVCLHVQKVIRSGWDAWDPKENVPRPMPTPAVVPIFAQKQGPGSKNTSGARYPLWVTLALHEEKGLYAVYTADGNNNEYVGTLAPGEGRAVLRDLVIDWLLGTDLEKLECRSPYHGNAEQADELYVFSKAGTAGAFGVRVRNAWSMLMHDACYLCHHDVGYPPEDL